MFAASIDSDKQAATATTGYRNRTWKNSIYGEAFGGATGKFSNETLRNLPMNNLIPTDVVSRFYVPCRFGQLHVRRSGGVSAHPSVLMLHQVPNSGQVFESILPLLGKDRLALAADTPGYGMSDPAPDPQKITDYADAIADAISVLGLAEIDLVGYHTGAAIAAELSFRRNLRVRRVVLVAVPVFDDQQRATLGALPPIEFDEDGGWARDEWRRTWRWRGPGQSRADLLKGFAEKMRFGARERGAQAVAAYDMATALSHIRQPLMIVRPRDDLWDSSARARQLRPDAHYVELPDHGHGIWSVMPQEMDALLREFLKS